MPRPKGTPRTGGRVKGTPNKRTLDGEAYARAIVEDPLVRARLLQMCQVGEIPVELLKLLFAYAYGKPSEVPPDGDRDTPRTITLQF
jgi:hypothetical protein